MENKSLIPQSEIDKTIGSELSVPANETEVGRALDNYQVTLGQEVAMKALNLVKPMIKSVAQELSDTLGDNEQIIVIRKTKAGSPVSILILDTKEDFTIKGCKANNGKFLFSGEVIPGTKKPKACKKYYIAEEFVDMLLTGRMTELTKKLSE